MDMQPVPAISFTEPASAPPGFPRLNLFVSYCDDLNPHRQVELAKCLRMNQNNPLIATVTVVSENAGRLHPEITGHPKYRGVSLPRRTTYNDLFAAVNKLTGPDDINIIANADIFFDQTLLVLGRYNLVNTALVVSRWDIRPDGWSQIRMRGDSQDVWIIQGPVRPMDGNFFTGQPGCDQAIAERMQRVGYRVTNPATELRCHHLHLSRVRRYSHADPKPPRPYTSVEPSAYAPGQLAKLCRDGSELRVLHFGLPDKYNGTRRAMAKLGTYFELTWRGMPNPAAALREAWEHFKPHVTYMQVQAPGVLTPALMKDAPGVVVNWTGDVRSPLPEWYIDIGREIDLTLFSNTTDVATARERGINADFWNIGYDQTVFTPIGPRLDDSPRIVFMGNNYPYFPLSRERTEMVRALQQRYGARFQVYGNRFGGPRNSDSHEDQSQVYRSCDIAINQSHFEYGRYSSDRIFRIMGSGAFCLTRWFPELEKDYTPGRHLAVWNGFDDLMLKIDYYLEHVEARKAIARAGWALVQSRDTFDTRVEYLYHMIQPFLRRKNLI
jgi:hypothetical protein